MSHIVWEDVQVHWCQASRWVVRGVIKSDEGERFSEYLDDFSHQADAIDEAKIYAFDTSCGPARGLQVTVYTKDDRVKQRIQAAA